MAGKLTEAGTNILQRGVLLDSKKRYTEALVCYQEGLQLLIDAMKNMSDPNTKKQICQKIDEYMKRAESVKDYLKLKKMDGKYHEQIEIKDNSTGNSYKSVFGRFLDADVVEVHIEDPYIRSFFQCQNFLRFCELLVHSCPNLKKITLVTTTDTQIQNEQNSNLQKIEHSLQLYNISLCVTISSTLHDRQIKLGNGWIIKIGRGLDYFKNVKEKFTIGQFEMDLRPCHETIVDIFHVSGIKN